MLWTILLLASALRGALADEGSGSGSGGGSASGGGPASGSGGGATDPPTNPPTNPPTDPPTEANACVQYTSSKKCKKKTKSGCVWWPEQPRGKTSKSKSAEHPGACQPVGYDRDGNKVDETGDACATKRTAAVCNEELACLWDGEKNACLPFTFTSCYGANKGRCKKINKQLKGSCKWDGKKSACFRMGCEKTCEELNKKQCRKRSRESKSKAGCRLVKSKTCEDDDWLANNSDACLCSDEVATCGVLEPARRRVDAAVATDWEDSTVFPGDEPATLNYDMFLL